jgi:hypothetical protein
MGQRIGFNYQQILASLEFLKIEPNKELFDGLKIIETTILKELSKVNNG